jgi:hypothetical protein
MRLGNIGDAMVPIAIDTNPGPLQGQPLCPSGTVNSGPFCIFADGSFVDVRQSAGGAAPLQQPPAGWQSTLMGQNIQFDTPVAPPTNALVTSAPYQPPIISAPQQNVLAPPSAPAPVVPAQTISTSPTTSFNGAPPPFVDASFATLWIEKYWPLLAAGVAALVVLPNLTGGNR